MLSQNKFICHILAQDYLPCLLVGHKHSRIYSRIHFYIVLGDILGDILHSSRRFFYTVLGDIPGYIST